MGVVRNSKARLIQQCKGADQPGVWSCDGDPVLPDKSTIRIAIAYYSNLLNNFGFTYVNATEDYVIYPDGSQPDIEVLYDEE